METVKLTREVNIADVDGNPISEGSVLAHMEGDARGVVARIERPGEWPLTGMSQIGDMAIYLSPGVTRHTNCYTEWRHIPKFKQTAIERYWSWIYTPFYFDNYGHLNKDEQVAMGGIMALLPKDWDSWEGDWDDERPANTEEALKRLAQYLDEVQETKLCKKTQ